MNKWWLRKEKIKSNEFITQSPLFIVKQGLATKYKKIRGSKLGGREFSLLPAFSCSEFPQFLSKGWLDKEWSGKEGDSPYVSSHGTSPSVLLSDLHHGDLSAATLCSYTPQSLFLFMSSSRNDRSFSAKRRERGFKFSNKLPSWSSLLSWKVSSTDTAKLLSNFGTRSKVTEEYLWRHLRS